MIAFFWSLVKRRNPFLSIKAILIPSPVPIFLVIAAFTAFKAITLASSRVRFSLNSSSSKPYATGEPLPVVTYFFYSTEPNISMLYSPGPALS